MTRAHGASIDLSMQERDAIRHSQRTSGIHHDTDGILCCEKWWHWPLELASPAQVAAAVIMTSPKQQRMEPWSSDSNVERLLGKEGHYSDMPMMTGIKFQRMHHVLPEDKEGKTLLGVPESSWIDVHQRSYAS